MKKTMSFLLTLTLVLSCLSMVCFAANTASGKCESNLMWTFDKVSGKLTVTGTGEMGSCFDEWVIPWEAYTSQIKTVVIQQGVTSIGSGAFANCTLLTSVTLPNGLTDIGAAAFCGCRALENISLPGTVTDFWWSAFQDCSSLKSIKIPHGVMGISDDVFSGCSGLVSVTFPCLTSIGDYAFHNCFGLKDIYYSGSKELWDEIEICWGNDPIRYAAIHYNALDFIYSDVSVKAWYATAVGYVTAKGIFTGYTSGAKAGKFGVSDPIQRQDFLVALARYDDVYPDLWQWGDGGFRDVADDAYYAYAVCWGEQNGITGGYTSGPNAGKFGVGDNITREQLVTFMYRYARFIGANMNVSSGASYWENIYPDFHIVSAFAKDAIIWALERGVISGKTVGRDICIAPQGNAQRCEVAQIFYNIEQKNVFSATYTPAFYPYLVKVNVSSLPVRKGPGTNYAKVTTITDKGTYTIVEEAYGEGAAKWGKLKSGAGWIALDNCTKK